MKKGKLAQIPIRKQVLVKVKNTYRLYAYTETVEDIEI